MKVYVPSISKDMKVQNWWNGFRYYDRKQFEPELKRLGMDVTRDEYHFSTYEYGNLMEPTKRAITRLYDERFKRP